MIHKLNKLLELTGNKISLKTFEVVLSDPIKARKFRFEVPSEPWPSAMWTVYWAFIRAHPIKYRNSCKYLIYGNFILFIQTTLSNEKCTVQCLLKVAHSCNGGVQWSTGAPAENVPPATPGPGQNLLKFGCPGYSGILLLSLFFS